jgi:non-specific serine/threonine protein kinase/serine/threonine-protein kinase
MKAIEKERGRRYESASAFAEDIGRHLRSEPVQAAPPSTGYRMRTFVRRHRGAVVAATLVAASLLVGLAGFAWQAQVARQQARRADERAAELEQVSGFQSDMLNGVDPQKAGLHLSKAVRAKLDAALAAEGLPDAQRQAQLAAFDALWHRIDATDTAVDLIDASILKPALAAIDKQFGKQPLVDAQLREAISDDYDTMGLYEASLALQRDVFAKRLRVLGHDAPDTQLSLRNLANELETSGRLGEAEGRFRDAYATSLRLNGQDSRPTLEAMLRLAGILDHRGQLAQAEALDRYVATRAERVFGAHDHKTFSAAQELGRVLHDEGRLQEAEPWLRKALAGRQESKDEIRIVTAMDDLDRLLQSEGKLAEAEVLTRENAERTTRALGAENPESLKSMRNLGNLLRQEGKVTEAEPILRRTLATARRALGNDDPETLGSAYLLGLLLLHEGKTADAEPLLREALAGRTRVFRDGDRHTLMSKDSMAELYLAQGKFAQAESLLAADEAAARREYTGDDERLLGQWLLHLGLARAHLGQAAASKAALQEASRLLSKPGGATHEADMRAVAQALQAP